MFFHNNFQSITKDLNFFEWSLATQFGVFDNIDIIVNNCGSHSIIIKLKIIYGKKNCT